MKKSKLFFLKLWRRIRHFTFLFKKLLLARENKVVLYSVLTLIGVLLSLVVLFVVLEKINKKQSVVIEEVKKPIRHSLSKIQSNSKEALLTSEDDLYTKPEGELSDLIQKANILYNNGRTEEALEIFKSVSLYSQSLANYNLGVIYSGEKDFVRARKMFKNAIEGGDNVALSALNAAYSAFKLKDLDSFDHFIRLADQTLYDSAKSPFYSYLYALVSFYKNQYFEALSPLLNPNSKNYKVQNNTLASEMFLILGDDYSALHYLQKDTQVQNMLALGMLYARNGDYHKASEKIRDYLTHFPNNPEAISALELVELKLGDFGGSADLLNSLKGSEAFFKIKTRLSPYLFDINQAQGRFWNIKFESRKSLQYKILFYYAPYRVFDVQQAFRLLSEGGFEWSMGNIVEARDSYVRGGTISRINREITMGLKEIYTGDLRKALKIFLNKANTYAQHPVLYYNIALAYAQLGDFENAYSYFSKAYYLDSRDLMSGIFAVMTGKLVYQDTSRLIEMLRGDFVKTDFKDADQKTFLYELFSYAREKKNEGAVFVKDFERPKPIYYALQAIYAMAEENQEKIDQSFSLLKKSYPNDLTTELMYQIAKNYGENLKEMSLKFSSFFRSGGFSNMYSLYYGGSLTRELYIYLAFVTGNLSFVISHLQEKLTTQEASPIGIMQALGAAYIYNKEFEKAFVLYNDLIDNLKQKDAGTKFMGAVAAIGSGHHNLSLIHI